ncbi:LVIVD repeat-containing protein [Hymenobacter tenuis]
MHKFYATLLLATLLLSLSACPIIDPVERIPLPRYKPLLMARPQLEQAVAVLPPQPLHNTGKIYLHDPYLFINERYEGIHIINNENPAHPQPVAFLRIPGNVDVAMKGALLYADSGSDLLTFDLSNPPAARLLYRLREAIPELAMPENGDIPVEYQPQNRPADAVVVGWQKL